MLRCRNCTATSAFLQCGSHLDQKLRCRERKTALQHRKSCVAGKCRFPAGFKPPRLGTHVSDLLKMQSEGNFSEQVPGELCGGFFSGFFGPFSLVFFLFNRRKIHGKIQIRIRELRSQNLHCKDLALTILSLVA